MSINFFKNEVVSMLIDPKMTELTFVQYKSLIWEFKIHIIIVLRDTKTRRTMHPNFPTSNFFSPRPLEMTYYPFYPYFCHNSADLLFYGWKNAYYTQGFTTIKPDLATQVIDKP